jgi:hypothetical protein
LDIQSILAELRKEQRNLRRAIAALEKLQPQQRARQKMLALQIEELAARSLSKKRKKKTALSTSNQGTRAEIILFPKPARPARSIMLDSRRQLPSD